MDGKRVFIEQVLAKFGITVDTPRPTEPPSRPAAVLRLSRNPKAAASPSAGPDQAEPHPPMPATERERHYRVCHAIAKQFDIYPEMRAFMLSEWQATSMRDMPDQGLADLLGYLREIERRIFDQDGHLG